MKERTSIGTKESFVFSMRRFGFRCHSNGIAGNIWDNFSSQTYKELPAVGKYKVQHPVTGEWREIDIRTRDGLVVTTREGYYAPSDKGRSR